MEGSGDDTPDVFLCCPSGDASMYCDTHSSIVHASRKYRAMQSCLAGSHLPKNFARLWVEAVGSGCKYFAMIHADVAATRYWLDEMIEVLESADADIVSAVVAIKDHTGDSSTAYEIEPRRPRRLSLAQIQQLPAVFSDQDVAELVGSPVTLLVNTGLWVARLDRPWATEIDYFVVDARIVWDVPNKTASVLVNSEDWELSRRFKELGLRVLVNRQILTVHHGSAQYTNGAAVALQSAPATT